MVNFQKVFNIKNKNYQAIYQINYRQINFKTFYFKAHYYHNLQ